MMKFFDREYIKSIAGLEYVIVRLDRLATDGDSSGLFATGAELSSNKHGKA